MVDPSMIKLGPVGGSNGEMWDEKGRSEIVQIIVSHDYKLYSIRFQYYENGTLVLSDRFGSDSGNKFDVVRLDYPREYLTCVSGYMNQSCLTSITFTTNLGTHGPFGQSVEENQEFRFQLGRDRQLAGFCGTASYYLASIGVYFKPIRTLQDIQFQNQNSSSDEEDAYN